jgi:hypothetical protein
MSDRLRNKKKDKAKKTKDLYGKYTAKNVRIYEAEQERRQANIQQERNKQLEKNNEKSI